MAPACSRRASRPASPDGPATELGAPSDGASTRGDGGELASAGIGCPVAAPLAVTGGSFFLPPGDAGEGGETEPGGGRQATRRDALPSSFRIAPNEIMFRLKSCCALLGRSAVVASSTLEARSGGTDDDVRAVPGLLPSPLIVAPKPWILLLWPALGVDPAEVVQAAADSVQTGRLQSTRPQGRHKFSYLRAIRPLLPRERG